MKRTLLILGAVALLTGCGKPAGNVSASAKHLTTGRVDTAVILQADPDYQKTAEEYLKEQLAVKDKFFAKFKVAHDEKDEEKKKEIGAAYTDAQQKLDEKWKKKTAEFLQSRHERLRAAAEQVAKDQKIDLVVVDSKEYPSVEFGATDITQEVMLRMTGTDNKTPGPQESTK